MFLHRLNRVDKSLIALIEHEAQSRYGRVALG